jgi:hypothetical protein
LSVISLKKLLILCADSESGGAASESTMDSPGLGCADTPDKPSPTKRKLKNVRNKIYRRNKALKKQAKAKTMSRRERKEFVIKELYDLLPESCARFVETQLRVADKSKHGRRWTDSDKVFALSLFHCSRKAYAMLKKIFTLPSVSICKRLYYLFSNSRRKKSVFEL